MSMAALMFFNKGICFEYTANPHNLSKIHSGKGINAEYVAPRRAICGPISARENAGKGSNRYGTTAARRHGPTRHLMS